MTQAALTGQGVVLARTPLVAEHLKSGDLVEPLPKLRIDSPMAFWLILSPRARSPPTPAPRSPRFATGSKRRPKRRAARLVKCRGRMWRRGRWMIELFAQTRE